MGEWKDKNVLITGASSGIGEAFAYLLAAQGANLAITARSLDKLQVLAETLRSRHAVKVEVVTSDLAAPTGARRLVEALTSREFSVELLINNAGFGARGEFADLSIARQLEMIQVNVSSLVELTHLILPDMKSRREGAILNVASTASFQAVPYFAVYGATKAFVLSFSEALWYECKTYGIRVTALCPGSTATNFQDTAGSQTINGPRVIQTPDEVAVAGLAALAAGRSSVVSGRSNRFQSKAQRLLPRNLVTSLAGRIFKPGE